MRDSLQLLTEARSSFRSLLFLRDSPPLWPAVRTERQDLWRELEETHGRALARPRPLPRNAQRAAHQPSPDPRGRAGGDAYPAAPGRPAWRADDPRLEASGVVFERPSPRRCWSCSRLTPAAASAGARLVDALGVLLVLIPVLRLLPRLLEPAHGARCLRASRLRGARPRSRRGLEQRLLRTLAAAPRDRRRARLPGLDAASRAARCAACRHAHPPRLGVLLHASFAAARALGGRERDGLGAPGADPGGGRARLRLPRDRGLRRRRVVRTALRGLLRSDPARHFGLVRRHGSELHIWLRRAVHSIAFGIWGYFSLTAFSIDDWVQEVVGGLFGAEPSSARCGSRSATCSPLDHLAGTFVLSRLLRFILEDDVMPRLPAGAGWATRSPPLSTTRC